MVSAGCASAGGHEWAATALWLRGWSADTKIAADICLKSIPSTWRKKAFANDANNDSVIDLSMLWINYPGSRTHLPRVLLGLTLSLQFLRAEHFGGFPNSNPLLGISSNDLKSSAAIIDLKNSSRKVACWRSHKQTQQKTSLISSLGISQSTAALYTSFDPEDIIWRKQLPVELSFQICWYI